METTEDLPTLLAYMTSRPLYSSSSAGDLIAKAKVGGSSPKGLVSGDMWFRLMEDAGHTTRHVASQPWYL